MSVGGEEPFVGSLRLLQQANKAPCDGSKPVALLGSLARNSKLMVVAKDFSRIVIKDLSGDVILAM